MRTSPLLIIEFYCEIVSYQRFRFSPKKWKVDINKSLFKISSFQKNKQPLCETLLYQLTFQYPQIDVRQENNVFLEGVNKLERYSWENSYIGVNVLWLFPRNSQRLKEYSFSKCHKSLIRSPKFYSLHCYNSSG